MGNFADAGELTYLEKTFERLGYYRDKAWWRWAASLAQNWLWGYGEKPWRLALVMVFNIILFVGYGDLAPHTPLARFISVLCAAAGIATFGLLIASVTKKIMYR